MNECVMGTDDCPHLCDNTEGSFTCRCRAGFQSINNGRDCRDINECDLETDNCGQRCTNTPGSFTCSCMSGFNLNSDQATCTGWLLTLGDVETGCHVGPCFQKSTSVQTAMEAVLRLASTLVDHFSAGVLVGLSSETAGFVMM